MSPWFYVNGKYVRQDEALIPIDNTGINRAFGIFDLFRTRDTKPTFFDDYLNRFDRSQQFLNLSKPVNVSSIQEIVSELQNKNNFQHSTFKLLLLGDGPDSAPSFDPHFSVLNIPFDPGNVPSSINVITYPYVREHALIKSLNYFTSFSLQQQKFKAKASEVIFHKEDIVSEASRSNLFFIKDGVLFTPEKNILHGITRKHVIASAKEILTVEVGDYTLSNLKAADEAFLTSTTKEVMPITAIDGIEVGTGKSSAITHRIAKNFRDYLMELAPS